MKKRFLSLLLVVALAGTGLLAGCGDKKDTSETKETKQETLSPANLSFGEDGFATVASNADYELKMNETASAIQVVESGSGHVWDSRTTDPNFDPSTVNKKWQQKLMSPFEIYCTDLDSGLGNVKNYALNELNYDTVMEALDNGVRVTYDLKSIEIKIALDYVLTDTGLDVTVPDSCIDEYGSNSLTSLKVLPYFAAASDDSQGYYFYPDGSGAIMEFSDISHYGESEVALNVYGNIYNYKESIDVLSEEDTEVLLPVFGANLNNSGFLAIITDGDDAAQIKITSTTSIIPVNSICAEFVYRRQFTDLRIEDGTVNTFDKQRIEGDRCISYRLLDEGATTYSDMASVYRDYLIGNGVDNKTSSDTVPLMLELFMAIKEDGFIVDPTIVTTSFDQAESILDEMEELGIEDINLQLRGWTKNGYYTDPVQFPVNKKAGGSKGLKNLLEYASDKNIRVFLASNFLEAREGSSGFNEQNDVVYLGNRAIWQSGDLYLLSPTKSQEIYTSFEKTAEKYDISGVSFLSIGQYLAYNYNDNDYVTKASCKEIWQTMLSSSKETFGSTVVEGGNAYVLGNADIIMAVPLEDSGYQITTKSVPFYQMAVHGLVDFTGRAGNLSSDLTKDKLKWVEYGYLPYFELTYTGSEDLMYTDYNTLYSSTYSSWLEEAASIYKEFNEELTDVRNAYMLSHEEIEEDVYKVTYDNGYTVYVNYRDESVTVDGQTIEAEAYKVVKKG
jgi:hypothetical protein